MSFPVPHPGLVIRYSYLWKHEEVEGCEEGHKDRPCAVVVAFEDSGGRKRVFILFRLHTLRRNRPIWELKSRES